MFNLGLALLVAGLLLGAVWTPPALLVALAGVVVWLWAVVMYGLDRWRGVPLPTVHRSRVPASVATDGFPVEPDRLVALDDPELPPELRGAVQRDARPGDVLWRCVRRGAPCGPWSWLGWGHRPLVVEWWLVSAEGELLEAYWLQP